MRITARRKYNAPQRRRDLADAALTLLGTDGARGLSHPRVDRGAGVPPGTTSYYFRTRKALLLGIAERLTALDLADLSMMSELARDDTACYSGTLGLARLVILSGTEPYLTRSRARTELALMAGRDPDVAQAMRKFGIQFTGLIREVVGQWHGGRDVPRETVDQQTTAVLLLVSGAMTSYTHGYALVDDAEQLDAMIRRVLINTDDEQAAVRTGESP